MLDETCIKWCVSFVNAEETNANLKKEQKSVHQGLAEVDTELKEGSHQE